MISALGLALAALLPCAAVQDAPAVEPVPQERIDAAIDLGVEFLRGVATPGEGRRAKKARVATERSGLRALVLYTMMKCGAAADEPAVRALLTGLAEDGIDQTYDAACLAMALSAHDPIEHRLWIEALTEQLLGWQEPTGQWGYPGMILDLSNTQYAALGLWAGARSHVPIEPAVWERLARAVLGYRDRDGGFGYTPAEVAATGSMTTAGVGTLAICELQLRAAGALDPGLAAELAAARRAGLDWFGERFSVETNPAMGAWHYYYLYGLERMGALVGVAFLGAHDWYQEGARFLVERQDESGSWQGGTDLSETCFALLFLKRATTGDPLPVGPRTGPRPPELEEGDLALDVQGRGPCTLAIDSWRRAAIAPHEWPGERGLGPHVILVEYFAGDRLVGAVLGDPDRPARHARFALSWVPRAAGEQQLTARVTVALPDSGGEALLTSAPKVVEVGHALPAWHDDEPHGLGPDLALSFRPKASASSRLKGAPLLPPLDFDAERAVDGRPGTPWLAAEKDAKRALKVTYRKPGPVDVLRVFPAGLPAFGAGLLSRPAILEIEVNGGDPRTVRLEEAGRPATIVFEEPLEVRRVTVRIVEVEPGVLPFVGVGEVALYLRPE